MWETQTDGKLVALNVTQKCFSFTRLHSMTVHPVDLMSTQFSLNCIYHVMLSEIKVE